MRRCSARSDRGTHRIHSKNSRNPLDKRRGHVLRASAQGCERYQRRPLDCKDRRGRTLRDADDGALTQRIDASQRLDSAADPKMIRALELGEVLLLRSHIVAP